MREPPTDLTDADVLSALRHGWGLEPDRLDHLPVGFGAHHWAATHGASRRWFVTYDTFGTRHTAATLEAAYVAAAAVTEPFVVGCLPTRSGRLTRPAARGALSLTPWVEGVAARDHGFAGPDDVAATAAVLARLHAVVAPPTLPRWRPLVGAGFPGGLAARLVPTWRSGPHAARVQAALCAAQPRIESWVAAYHRGAERARAVGWVPTHGEPHAGNQLATPTGLRLVDWESFKLAPRERDLVGLVASGHDWATAYAGGPDVPDWGLVEMFDLEWRLDEVSQYAAWFEAPHDGGASDTVAIEGLVEELERPDWTRPTG